MLGFAKEKKLCCKRERVASVWVCEYKSLMSGADKILYK